MTDPTTYAMDEEVEVLLRQLDDVDRRLRSVYRELADDPGRADEHDGEVHALHARRSELAKDVGLAVLARRQAAHAAPPNASRDEAARSVNGALGHDAGSTPHEAATADELAAWRRSASENGLGRVAYEDRFVATWDVALDRLMTALGPPRALDIDVDEELDGLDRVGREPLAAEWAALPRVPQQQWLGLLVARARAVKAVAGLSASQRDRWKTIITRYPAWAAEHRPGHVNGLQLNHGPIGASWLEDAKQLWGSLAEILASESGAPSHARALAKKKAPRDEASSGDLRQTIDPGWPLWSLVRGRRALMVGGDPREPNRARLEHFFEFASLEWPDIDGPRRTEAVVARIKKRTVEVVVVLQGFVDHAQAEPIISAAKAHDVTWVLAEGYGVTAIRNAFERFHPKT